MDRDQFWEIIDHTSRDDGFEQIAALREELDRLPWFEVVAFQARFVEAILEAQTYNLLAAASLINGACSAEGFRDFRVWLVGRGHGVYQAAIANPDSLASLLTGDAVDGFGLDGVAVRAYEAKTGMSDFVQRLAGVPHERTEAPPDQVDAAWDYEDPAALRLRFPRLCELYLTPSEDSP